MPFDGGEFTYRQRMIETIDEVLELFDVESKWCKGKLKTPDGWYCILGALLEVGAASLVRGVILKAAKAVTGHRYSRIEHFNDDPPTDYPTLIATLRRARQDIALGRMSWLVRVRAKLAVDGWRKTAALLMRATSSV